MGKNIAILNFLDEKIELELNLNSENDGKLFKNNKSKIVTATTGFQMLIGVDDINKTINIILLLFESLFKQGQDLDYLQVGYYGDKKFRVIDNGFDNICFMLTEDY